MCQNSMQGVTETIRYEWRVRQAKGGKLPSTRNNAAAVITGEGLLYQVGGFGAGTGRSSEVWRYSLNDNLWELAPNKGHDNPPSRDGQSCTLIEGGSFLMFGGQGTPSQNEKSERNFDPVRTKTFLVRDLYNDLFKYDCKQEKWTMLCPEGGVPLCRRGHSAIYVPANSLFSSTSTLPSHHTSNQGGGGGGGRSPDSFKKSKSPPKKTSSEYPPVPGNSLVVFGGSGMEVSKYIEAVYSDVWVYNIDLDRWAKQRTRGADPKPLFEHRSERVGDIMVVVGGITSTNAKPFSSGEPVEENTDVMLFNLRTLTWSFLALQQGPLSSGLPPKSARLQVHGHSLCLDPCDPSSGVLFVFGGKDTIDGRHAAQESVAGAKRLLKRAPASNAFTLDVKAGVLTPVDTGSLAPPEQRYEHVGISLTDPSAPARSRDRPAPKKNYRGELVLPPPFEEPLLLIFGGSRTDHGGYCDNTVHELVRVRAWVNTNSVGGGHEADVDADGLSTHGSRLLPDGGDQGPVSSGVSVHSMHSMQSGNYSGAGESTHGGESSQGSAPHDDDDADKRPSIWDKVQAQQQLAGLAPREPNNWVELKLSLSRSLTEKRSVAAAKALAAAAASQASRGRGNGHVHGHGKLDESGGSVHQQQVETDKPPGSSEGSAPPVSSAYAKALEARRLKERIKTMSESQVLPLVRGAHLSFVSAKSSFMERYPPFVPPPVSPPPTAPQSLALSLSQSHATLRK